MDDFEEPSVLEYARSQGIARNHGQLDPIDLLAQIRDSEHAQSHSTIYSTQSLDLETSNFANRTSIFTSKPGKLVLDKDGVKFLTSVLQEVISIQAKPDHRAEESISLKLRYKPRDDLKIDVPLISAEKEDTLKALGKTADPVTLLNEIVPDLADRERDSVDEGLEFPDYFWELPSMLDRDPSTEKLEASIGTARVLQEALVYLDEKRHRKDIEGFINNFVLDIVSSSHLPIPPLYIESEDQYQRNIIRHSRDSSDMDNGRVNKSVAEDVVTPGLLEEDYQPVGEAPPYIGSDEQHECNVIPKSHLSNDTDTGLVNEAVVEVEEVVTPGLLEEDYQPVGDTPPCVESEEQHECNVIPESLYISDIDTGHVNEAVVEDVAIPDSLEENSQRVGNAVPNTRLASPLVINEAEVATKRSTRSRTALSPVTNPPAPFVGSLGTLLAFMQTRSHKNKRQKLDHESRYFSSTPKNSTKASPNKLDTPEKPIEPIKVLSSSSAATHDIQSVNLYPKNPSKSNTPLLLIVSTQLLRSDSTLVRSLEDISTSQFVRLIFRDYQGAKSGQSLVTEEADLVVSPTTGIILASSHETTQRYLPGQGPPGIDSPLQARIVRSVSRYEMLYMLIRSPIETSMNILSSVRDLTTYCLSLDHVCNIKVLLITTDHVLQWILSIAAKHTTDSHPLNATDGRISVSHFHDDPSQWEVFLRSAGLNPFAAQSVLAMLKTSSAQSGGPGDINQASALSIFVEMPYQTRRDIFREIVGHRVLSRVEKALEMDWQVDWAVDLT